MSKFQLGLMVGFFLGGLAIFVFLGISQLLAEDRREKAVRAREQAAREIQAALEGTALVNHDPGHLPCVTVQDPALEGEETICYVSIRIE